MPRDLKILNLLNEGNGSINFIISQLASKLDLLTSSIDSYHKLFQILTINNWQVSKFALQIDVIYTVYSISRAQPESHSWNNTIL